LARTRGRRHPGETAFGVTRAAWATRFLVCDRTRGGLPRIVRHIADDPVDTT
jgi:hypothetical protein